MSTPRRNITIVALSALVVVALVVAAVVYLNRPRPVAPVDSQTLREAVTTENLMAHLQALQEVADAHGGNRQAGTPGHEASVDYVEEQLRAAGYQTHRQQFTYRRHNPHRATLERTAPTPTAYAVAEDFRPLNRSGSGTVTAEVVPVDVNLAGDRATTSGCEASDFDGFPEGGIALVQRGTCRFDTKVEHAVAAGAGGVVIVNQGNTDERTGLFEGNLGATAAIPVVATTFAHGVQWASTPTTLTMSVDPAEPVTTENLIADTAGDPEHTIIVGAHLDGVASGPGINDNGSGVAAVLETAVQLGRLGVQPTNRVRLAFWSGEEDGLHGSTHYVAELDEPGRRAIELYLNLDMVGSPNAVASVYDGFGGRDHPVGQLLRDFLTNQGHAPRTVTFDGSDHAPFVDAGIPVSGLYTGADEEGADAGPADPCYHLACDRVDDINPDMLGLMADALAHGVLAAVS